MSDLSRFKKQPKQVQWEAMQATLLAKDVVMAFDQSLRNTGWVILDTTSENPWVEYSGTLKTTATSQKGWQSTLDSAVEMYEKIEQTVAVNRFDTEMLYAFESPALFGRRLESSALAAFCIRLVANQYEAETEMVSAQKMKKLITGNANASKADVKTSILDLTWIGGAETLKNEHERDALGIGLTALALRGRGVQ